MFHRNQMFIFLKFNPVFNFQFLFLLKQLLQVDTYLTLIADILSVNEHLLKNKSANCLNSCVRWIISDIALAAISIFTYQWTHTLYGWISNLIVYEKVKLYRYTVYNILLRLLEEMGHQLYFQPTYSDYIIYFNKFLFKLFVL